MLASFVRRGSVASTSSPCRLYMPDAASTCSSHAQRCAAPTLCGVGVRAAGSCQGFPLDGIVDWDISHAIDDLQHSRWQRCPVNLASADEDHFAYDVLGVGQGMVDFAASVDDDLLERCNVPKGGRRVITVEERANVIEQLSGLPSRLSAGGSLANTLVGLARLGACQSGSSSSNSSGGGRQGLRVAIGGAIGGDALGKFFASQLGAAGVQCIGTPPAGSQTGTVMVFATPDAQRSFLSYFSNNALTISPELEAAVQRSRLVVIEGYLFELPGAAAALPALVRSAKQAGAAVALTAGDAGVVVRHRQAMLDTISAGVDVLFTNSAEATELLHDAHSGASTSSGASSRASSSSQDVAGVLGRQCPGTVAVVTDGSCGSYISAGGRVLTVPPAWSAAPPVDTCGAGDAYAAGLLFGLLQGLSLPAMGCAAARTASAVIGRLSPHLHEQDAENVVAGLPLKLSFDSLSLGLQGLLAGDSSKAVRAHASSAAVPSAGIKAASSHA